jgi:hypothetical protein
MKNKFCFFLLLLFSFSAAMASKEVKAPVRTEDPAALSAPETIITGKVTEGTGNSLANVTVQIKGGKRGVTDFVQLTAE